MGPSPKINKQLPPTDTAAAKAAADEAAAARLRSQRGYGATNLRGSSMLRDWANATGLKLLTGAA